MASEDLGEVVRALKSAAEPTRLRLLFLLSQAEYTVGELATVLNQSQPRISRHLRLLTEAGFLDRFREQQCVYYRAPTNARYLEWQRQLLSMADPDAQLLKRDRERAAQVIGDRARVAAQQLGAAAPIGVDGAAAGPPRTADAAELSSLLLEELGPVPVGELLDVGTGSGLMMQILGPRARRAVGLDISAPALRLARARGSRTASFAVATCTACPSTMRASTPCRSTACWPAPIGPRPRSPKPPAPCERMAG
jgi:DNA-binding transcriptional ArsR family regulator